MCPVGEKGSHGNARGETHSSEKGSWKPEDHSTLRRCQKWKIWLPAPDCFNSGGAGGGRIDRPAIDSAALRQGPEARANSCFLLL